jgi:hypothetical protein
VPREDPWLEELHTEGEEAFPNGLRLVERPLRHPPPHYVDGLLRSFRSGASCATWTRSGGGASCTKARLHT